MSREGFKRFRFSKTGVKVYVRPEYHPALKGIDLSHEDFERKSKEVFGKRHPNVSGLPKICSANSEDALTWAYFSPIISMPMKEKQRVLRRFLETALNRQLEAHFIETLGHAELLFWRGKKKAPFYIPPLTLKYPEANTEVDLTIRLEKATIFVEAKHHSEISMNTTYCKGRDQIIRNVDVGTYYAWTRSLDFYFVLLTTSETGRSIDTLNYYKMNPGIIAEKLSHRTDVSANPNRIAEGLGWTTWDKIMSPRK